MKKKNGFEKDINTLKSIVDKSIKVKLFDYDGQKYERKEAKILFHVLKADLKKLGVY